MSTASTGLGSSCLNKCSALEMSVITLCVIRSYIFCPISLSESFSSSSGISNEKHKPFSILFRESRPALIRISVAFEDQGEMVPTLGIKIN